MNTLSSGGLIVVTCSLVAASSVIVAWWLIDHGLLVKNQEFLNATYPIIGLVYGTFLAFTIVITWGKFNEAETSVTSEVTHVSELWRNAEAFPEAVCKEIHASLFVYAKEVVESGWASMAESGHPSPKANEKYQEIWIPYYGFEPVSGPCKFFCVTAGFTRNLRGGLRTRS